jgi:hypothetical protein
MDTSPIGRLVLFSRLVLQAKLHETGKRYEVSETGTIRNRPSKNGNVGGNAKGNAVYKKIKKIKK